MSQRDKKYEERKGEGKIMGGRQVEREREMGRIVKVERRDHGRSVSATAFYWASCKGRCTIQLTSDASDNISVPLPACAFEAAVAGLRHGRQKVISPGRG